MISWVDLDGRATGSVEWLKNKSGLPDEVILRLVEQNTLNHLENFGEGLLLRFQTPKDSTASGESGSTSVGLWFERDRVISIWSDTIPALETLKKKAAQHQGT
jgi:Mg2+ and Co2+ transporter CorA